MKTVQVRADRRRAELRLLKLLREIDEHGLVRDPNAAPEDTGVLINVSLFAEAREALKRFDERFRPRRGPET